MASPGTASGSVITSSIIARAARPPDGVERVGRPELPMTSVAGERAEREPEGAQDRVGVEVPDLDEPGSREAGGRRRAR